MPPGGGAPGPPKRAWVARDGDHRSGGSAWPLLKWAMQDLQSKLEKLLTEAEDCAIIGKLATDQKKRELFNKLAADLRGLARDIDAIIAERGDNKSK
jgi:hypothetical protein